MHMRSKFISFKGDRFLKGLGIKENTQEDTKKSPFERKMAESVPSVNIPHINQTLIRQNKIK